MPKTKQRFNAKFQIVNANVIITFLHMDHKILSVLANILIEIMMLIRELAI